MVVVVHLPPQRGLGGRVIMVVLVGHLLGGAAAAAAQVRQVVLEMLGQEQEEMVYQAL